MRDAKNKQETSSDIRSLTGLAMVSILNKLTSGITSEPTQQVSSPERQQQRLRELEDRMNSVDSKLDRILGTLEKRD